MKMLSYLAIVGLATAFTARSASADEAWINNLEKAKEVAKAEGKSILMNFTGSDWCGFCKIIDGKVLSKEEFTSKASEKYVLLTVDFPTPKIEQSAELKAQNQELKTKFGIRGFPTFVITDAEVNEKKRNVGAPAQDTEGFLKWLED